MRSLHHIIAIIATLLVFVHSRAEDDSTKEKKSDSSIGVDITKPARGFSVKGYYRFLGYHRNVSDYFNKPTKEVSVYQADDEFISPTGNVTVSFRPDEKTNLSWQMFFFSPLQGLEERDNMLALSRQGIMFTASRKTKLGNYSLWMGGIGYLKYSDFTLSSAQQVRTSLFDRSPWTYVWAGPTEQYSLYQGEGSFQRDIVWGKRQVNGVGIEGTDLPGGLKLKAFFGKTPFNLLSLPDNIFAFQLSKKVRLHNFGINVLRSSGVSSTLNGEQYGNQVAAATYKGNINEIKLEGEVASGSYFLPGIDPKWDVAALGIVRTTKRHTGLPLIAELYYVGPEFSNTHSSLINTSVAETQFSFNGENVADGARPSGGVMTPMHLKSNNRHGINLNTDFKLWKINFNLGNGISRDVKNEGNAFSFYHKVSGLFLSRVERFTQAAGGYGEVTTFFRGAYEDVNLSDTLADGSLNGMRNYNVSLLNAKFSTKVLGRDLFLFYLGEYQSLQNKWRPIPQFGDDAWFKTYFHEVDFLFNVYKKFSLVGYLGVERVIGSQYTDLGEQGLPRDQTARVLGAGFDISITAGSALYVRSKWVDFEDPNFANSHYKGFESSVEFKVIF